MAATEQLFNVRERKRFERHDIWERIAENGTISAAVMVIAAIAAVICANTDAYEAIHHFLETPLYVGLGNLTAGLTVEVFVNDFLMAIFFLLVGIELKYEMTVGELKNPRQAMLPMLAAVGGVVVPACIYLIFNHAGARNGWAIPMATDIAFALGVLSLLGNRVPNGVRVFFSTLAIADDLISIAAIAIFYGQSPSPFWLGTAAVVTCALVWLNKTQHYRLAPYSVLGLLLWFCMFKSGVHATLAGVILAFTIPAKCGVKLDSLTDWLGECLPLLDDRYDDEAHILVSTTLPSRPPESTRHAPRDPAAHSHGAPDLHAGQLCDPADLCICQRAGSPGGRGYGHAAHRPVTLGVYFGMLLGKPIGIFGMTFALVKLKISELPRNVNWHMIAGVGILGGIGFTMSILISGLAFPTAEFEVLAAKAAILAGSVTAAVLGMIYMSVVCKHPASKDE